MNAEGFHQGPVTIVISGNRPIDLIEHQTERWVFVDGRLSDMKSNQKPGLLIGLHIAETTVHKDPTFGLMFNQVDGAVARYDNGDGPLMESLRIHMRQDGSIGLDDLLANFISRRTLGCVDL